MFAKHYDVDESHIDFQGMVDGLYYPVLHGVDAPRLHA